MAGSTLSLCMIVKDESYFLPKCLSQSVDYVDEIIVVDTGSTDDTRDIAAKFTDKVYAFPWRDDFSAARNFSLESASGDWLVVLDADEVIEPVHWLQIRELIQETDQDAFFLTERNYSNESAEGRWIPISEKTAYTRNFSGYKPHYIARLFRNTPSIRYRGHVHEIIDHSLEEGRFQLLDIPIHHHGAENPRKPTRERQLNYLRLMEQDLDSDATGRLYATAGSIRMHFLQDYAKSIGYYEKAIELGWRLEESKEGLALARYLKGDLDDAYEGYLALHKSGYSSINLCINLANLAVKREQFSFAADLLEQALALGVVDPQVRMQLEHNIRYLRDKS